MTHMGLGLLLGFRHAFEADHIAAVATIVSRERSGWRSGALGACWGAGHLTSLLLIGLPVVGLGLHFPRGLDAPLELGVAAMIVFLGIGGLTRGPGRTIHAHSIRDLGKRPFWVGAAHGLAGSGALTLVILATMPSRAEGLLYLGTFGFGSILGMALASATLSIPLALSGLSAPAAVRIARAVSVASIAFGIFYGFTTIAGALSGHRLS
jgi:high-affinity nickel-transport protein